jgi:predicted negative regulator of RcsB-dependent stress response
MIESARGIEFLAWLELNKKRLIAGALLVALLISGLAIHRWRSAQQEIAANSALVQLQLPQANQEASQSGPRAEQFLEVSTQHRGTQAGRQAVYLAAAAFFREGKYAESQANFEAFRAASPGDPLAAGAALGVAACLEAVGKHDEAIAANREVIAVYPESAAATQAKLALAGLLEAKNESEQALQLYEQLRNSTWMNEAESRRQAILAQHPELAPTNSEPEEVAIPGLTTPSPTAD